MKKQQLSSENALTIQSHTIDWIRFPLMFLIIIDHVASTVIPQLTSFNILNIGFTGSDVYGVFRAVIDTARKVNVPGFFLISGYLFFYRVEGWNKKIYISKLKKRVFSLLIPYLIWNTIAALTRPVLLIASSIVNRTSFSGISEYFQSILEKGILNIYWHFNTWNETTINVLGWSTPNLGPISIPMWFLQSLICLSVITPLIYIIVRYLKIWGVAVLGLLCFTGIWFTFPGFRISAIFYFTLGAYFSINKLNMVFELRRFRYLLFPISVITLITTIIMSYSNYSGYNYTEGIFIMVATLSAFVIVSHFVEKETVKQHNTLTKSIFFIYASHTILFVVKAVGVLFGIVTFHSQAWFVLFLGYFIVPVVTAALCFVGYLFLRRLLPPVARVLSGNR